MKQGDLHVRRATVSDVDTLVRFNRAMALETEAKELDSARLEAGIRAVFDNPERGYYLVVETEGQVAGGLLMTYEWSDWRNGMFWWIQSVFVEREWRRRGVYRSLHDHVVATAEAEGGVCGIRLYVDQTNHRAQKTYKALGMDKSHYDMFEIDFVL
jgi:GNAT superfamily N-acetyltransferase